MLWPFLVLLGVTTGFAVGTLGEYWIHRAMHQGLVLARRHGDHHREGVGQGTLKELRDYASGAVAACIIGIPIDYYLISGGILAAGLVLGLLIHAIFAAWCHQAQHEDPRLLPWLSKTPVHFVHHELAQAKYNFGISVDWWDRIFQTYKPEPNWKLLIAPGLPRRAWWQINWRDSRIDARSHDEIRGAASLLSEPDDVMNRHADQR
jgi:sterol desaturase/sphingolipid hydroxylase (fatty acid hydroxylase superfamily)